VKVKRVWLSPHCIVRISLWEDVLVAAFQDRRGSGHRTRVASGFSHRINARMWGVVVIGTFSIRSAQSMMDSQ
jgi:hypothetical protein